VEICIRKYDDGVYSRMEFLRAISHSVLHTDVLRLDDTTASDTDDDTEQDEAQRRHRRNMRTQRQTCEVCLLQPRSAVALVPCGHSRFCDACADAVETFDSGCSLPLPHPNGPASIQLVHCLCDLDFLLEPYYNIAYLRTFGWVVRPRLFRCSSFCLLET